MSYRCDICDAVAQRGEPMRRWTIWRAGPPRQIAAEIPVCRICLAILGEGVEPAALRKRLGGASHEAVEENRAAVANGPLPATIAAPPPIAPVRLGRQKR